MAEQTKSGGSGIARKLLMPLVATAVSAAATYAGKRAPQLLEQRVMPKLREATSGSEDVAGKLADRAKSVVGGGSENGSRSRLSPDELETRQRERAEHRKARHNGSKAKGD